MTTDATASDRALVSVTFPVWNEEENLRLLYERVVAALERVDADFELVFVDNGSEDGSLGIIRELRERDPRVHYVSLSRNFGHQGGLLAGMRHCRGDAVITMDADLQHPAELIPEMVALWRQGKRVVYTTKKSYDLPALRRAQVRIFYWIVSKLSALELSFGQSDFRLLDRQVVDLIVDMPEYRKFLRGLVHWVGFPQAGLDYEVNDRHAGTSKFSFRSLISFAFDGILAFSLLPLRWSLFVGLAVATMCFGYGAFVVVLGVLNQLGGNHPLPPGWVSLSATALFLSSVQLTAIGLLSEYVGRIFEQTKGRPSFIVVEGSRDPR